MRGAVRQLGRLATGAVFILVWSQNILTAFATDVLVTLQDTSGNGEPMSILDIMFPFLFSAIVPSLVIVVTSFTRIVIVLPSLRNALGTQQSPPNQILVGLALFLTLFIVSPVLSSVNTQACRPYKAGTIIRKIVFEWVQEPAKEFILKQTEKKSLGLFLPTSKTSKPDVSQGPEGYIRLGLVTLVPSSILSELNKAFIMGFLTFILFLIIDLMVPSTLMSMGMVMLPPIIVALPFKIMMFVLVDGWSLVVKTLVQGFR